MAHSKSKTCCETQDCHCGQSQDTNEKRVTVNLDIEFVSTRDAAKTRNIPVYEVDAAMQEFGKTWFNHADFAVMRELEPIVLGWIRADPKNAAAFAVDPIRALLGSSIVLGPSIEQGLRTMLANELPPIALPPNVKNGYIKAR